MNLKPVIDNRYNNSIQILCLIRERVFPKYDFVINMVACRAGSTILYTAISSTMIYKSIGYEGKKNVARNEAAQKMYEQITIHLSKDEIDNLLQQTRIPVMNFDNKKTSEISTSPGILKLSESFLVDNRIDSFKNISAVDMLNTIAVGEDLNLTYFVREKMSGIMAEINIIDDIVFVGIELTIA